MFNNKNHIFSGFFFQGSVKGIVEINLSKYPDFSIKTNPPIGNEQCCTKNGQIYSVTVQPNESIEAELILIPAEVYCFL
ncbi:unnamed protein product [Rotaria sp. Silwood2]|nr:unnamed protein product [Rotaria sp. Silwood2]